ncbi:ATP-dependent 6-phosphofructokinase liver type [Dissostichus eleginoides]|uniref:ATP-dependent 6-phosphofructokinase liver type n=1 Tax=Dissostichus eleginoides TaxID=100907 RepID=A0AAD9CRI1_DISEL|nr:ATP-dependent 6-phosphofructokinase liver type [Dissostichus eleginoides]
MWVQDTWRKKYQVTLALSSHYARLIYLICESSLLLSGTDLPSVSPTILVNKITDKEPENTTLCSLLLINEGDNVNQTAPVKEFGARDGGQEPKSVDGGSSDGSFEEDVRLKGGGFRSHWGLYLAWTLCLLMSLCCCAGDEQSHILIGERGVECFSTQGLQCDSRTRESSLFLVWDQIILSQTNQRLSASRDVWSEFFSRLRPHKEQHKC